MKKILQAVLLLGIVVLGLVAATNHYGQVNEKCSREWHMHTSAIAVAHGIEKVK